MDYYKNNALNVQLKGIPDNYKNGIYLKRSYELDRVVTNLLNRIKMQLKVEFDTSNVEELYDISDDGGLQINLREGMFLDVNQMQQVIDAVKNFNIFEHLTIEFEKRVDGLITEIEVNTKEE